MFRGQKRRRRSRPLLLRQDPTVPTENVKGTAPQHVHPQTHEETTTAQSANSEQSRQGSKSLKMALAEINKRLQNQSKLWVCLASGLPLSTNAWQTIGFQPSSLYSFEVKAPERYWVKCSTVLRKISTRLFITFLLRNFYFSLLDTVRNKVTEIKVFRTAACM